MPRKGRKNTHKELSDAARGSVPVTSWLKRENIGAGSDTMKGIVPKSEAKGTDICGMGGNTYIIRSDLGCYMRTSDLNKGSDISIFSLHPACQNGDHYLGGEGGSFFIIKGNSFRRVMDLTTDSGAEVHDLHANYQGGDHCFTTNNSFCIIFKEKGICRTTLSLSFEEYTEFNLRPDCRNGLYYWSEPPEPCFLKPDIWGVECYFPHDLKNDVKLGVCSVHPDVLKFLPGGLSVTKGPSFGIWENIKTITNDSGTPVTWTKKITTKVGYNKEQMTQITHNWKIDASASIETGALAKLITKCQFSFSAEYGGSHVSTDNESWNEVTEVEEELSFELKPKERVYLWQYKLGFGDESVLFCRKLMITDGTNPPTEVPLLSAQSWKHIRML